MSTNTSTIITDIVLDFDGTCTQIPAIFDDYLEQYRLQFCGLVAPLSSEEWREAQKIVRDSSPKAGWTIAGCPSAPAAADPYILADETAKFILRERGQKSPSLPATLNAHAYASSPAPWRDDALDTFSRIAERGIRLHFISNSGTTMIEERLNQLIGESNSLFSSISVQSDAGKFRICELPWDNQNAISNEARLRFVSLPPTYGCGPSNEIDRPIYLRRGAYFESIYKALGGNLNLLESTVFCGDIWEMDLAMPFALGANVHLLDRAAPFETYDFERQAVAAYGNRAKSSKDLSGLLAWL